MIQQAWSKFTLHSFHITYFPHYSSGSHQDLKCQMWRRLSIGARLCFFSFHSMAFQQFDLLPQHFSRVDQLQGLMGVWCSLAAKCQQANEKRYLKLLSSIFNQALGYICCLIRWENSTSRSLWLLWKYLAEKLILFFKLCALSTSNSL